MEYLSDGFRQDEIKYTNLHLRYNQPLTLLRLAANVVRTRLQPNAVVGENILIAQGEIPEVLRHVITLGLSKEHFETGVLRKYIRNDDANLVHVPTCECNCGSSPSPS